MTPRTWNLKLMATEDHPETTLEGVPHDDAIKLLRRMIYGPDPRDHGLLRTAANDAPAAAHERPLAA